MSFMTNDEPGLAEALTVARRAIETGAVERDIDKALTVLARSLGASRIETGTIKALRAVVTQLSTPNMPDKVAWQTNDASRSNFMKWKARLRDAPEVWTPAARNGLPDPHGELEARFA